MTREYLIQYGTSAFVGRFAADADLVRGRRAVVESPRGRELGTVLCEPHELFAATVAPALDGRVLRDATADDEAAFTAAREQADRVLAAADLADRPAMVLDCEVLLDGSAAILHVTTWGDTDLTPVAESLSRQFDLPVRVHDLSATALPAEPAGCGKTGCGGGGCSSCGTGGGCGSGGGCSRGKVKSSEELTAYFRDLRAKMEADTAGRRELL